MYDSGIFFSIYLYLLPGKPYILLYVFFLKKERTRWKIYVKNPFSIFYGNFFLAYAMKYVYDYTHKQFKIYEIYYGEICFQVEL